jgi:putative oxidoreductase
MVQHLLEWSLDNAAFLLAVAIALELVGGLMIFLGIWVRLGALFLVIFIIPVTIVFHHFWQLHGADRTLQMIMFMKNLSIFGGLLYLIAWGKGCNCTHHHDHGTQRH